MPTSPIDSLLTCSAVALLSTVLLTSCAASREQQETAARPSKASMEHSKRELDAVQEYGRVLRQQVEKLGSQDFNPERLDFSKLNALLGETGHFNDSGVSGVWRQLLLRVSDNYFCGSTTLQP